MIRVVLDTNVFVSSFFGGNPRRIVDFWKTGEILLCTSKPMIDEYIEVLGRLGLHNQRELEELLNLFAQGFHILFAAKTPQLLIVEEDPEDNKFIECAVALKASFIISGDKALSAIQDYMGIKIVNPKIFLTLFKRHPR